MLANEIIALVVGFVLTTVLGGWLGAGLQRRTWDHQNEVQLRQDELRRADDVCHSVSTLLDKRLYRMRRFYLRWRRTLSYHKEAREFRAASRNMRPFSTNGMTA